MLGNFGWDAVAGTAGAVLRFSIETTNWPMINRSGDQIIPANYLKSFNLSIKPWVRKLVVKINLKVDQPGKVKALVVHTPA